MQNILNKNKTYFIAEAGVNHNGSFKEIKKLIINAKKCGADAVDFKVLKQKNFCRLIILLINLIIIKQITYIKCLKIRISKRLVLKNI